MENKQSKNLIEKIYPMYLFRLFSLLIVFPFIGTAQTERKSCLAFKDLKIEYDAWKEGGTAVIAFSRGGSDSVVFRESDQTTGSFIVKDCRIVSPCIVIKDQQGRIRSIDSLRMISPGSTSYFRFGYYALSAVKWEYEPNGIPSRASLKNQRGYDSVVREWYPSGILRKVSLKGAFPQTLLYYTDGVLKTHEKDTVINHWNVNRIRNYSEKGIIQTESWFKDGLPCADWFVYDNKGTLSKTIHHPSLLDPYLLPPLAMAIEDEFFILVDERSEFPGGQVSLSRYLESKLKRELCKHRFSGNTYVLRFEIEEDGTCVYKSLQGTDAIDVEPFFKTAIANCPRWKPAKRQGRAIRRAFSLSVQVL